MFGLSFTTTGLLAVWGILALFAVRLTTPIAQGVRLRLITLLGFFLVGGAFFFQPWIKFDFLDYLISAPEFLGQIFSGELLRKLIELLGVDWMSKLLHVFHMFTSFNGWQIEFIPTYGIWLRISTLLPLFPFVLSIVAVLFGSAYRGRLVMRALGGAMVFSGLLSAIALLLALPGLDALGIRGSFQWTLLATILGTRIGNGPWLCIFGLLLIIVGGLIELKDYPSVRISDVDY